MRSRSALRAAAAVACLFATGCLSQERGAPEDTATVSQATVTPLTICAQGAAKTDQPFCVFDTQGAAAAWTQATAKGTQPVQMWVPYQDSNLDAFVASKTELDAWFADITKVTTFLTTKANAEAIDASLNGNLGTLVKGAKAEQDKLIAAAPTSPAGAITAFENHLVDASPTASLDAALVLDNQSGAAVKAIVVAAQIAVGAFQNPFAAIAARFNAYRATEATEIAAYTKYAGDGASSTIATMPSVQSEIISYNSSQSATPAQFVIDATQLRMTIALEAQTYASQLDPYTDFMNSMGMQRPDLTSSAVRSLDNMMAYVQQRQERNDGLATRLLDELAFRRQTLVLIAANQATQASVAQEELLAASTTFLNNATSQITTVWAAPPTSVTLKLPYLAARYDAFTAFLQLQSLCSVGASGTWREAGCNSLNPQFSKAHTYLQTTLPGTIRIGVMLLGGAPGVTPAVLTDIQAKLTAGNTRGAAAEYDAALLASDG